MGTTEFYIKPHKCLYAFYNNIWLSWPINELSDHVDVIRERIYKSFNNQFSRLGRSSKLMEISKIQPNATHQIKLKP
jgi:hypothetical protein